MRSQFEGEMMARLQLHASAECGLPEIEIEFVCASRLIGKRKTKEKLF